MIAQQLSTTDFVLALAVVLLIAMASFLAMAETALTRMTRIRATTLAEEGRKGSRALKRIVDAPERYLNPLLLLLLLSHLVASSIIGALLAPFGPLVVTVGIVVEVITIFLIAEVIPKTFAVLHSDRAALRTAPFVAGIVGLPPVRILSDALLFVPRLFFRGRAPYGPSTSEQELLALADAALEEDVIERDERSMIHSIIEFGDTVAREVMKPRTDMVTVDADMTVDQAMDVAISAGFSRIPVIRGSKDDIAGIVYAKDLMRAQREGRHDVTAVTIARPARFAPESKRVSELMREMQTQKSHMAIVLDEYGGTAGLVTLEDLIEELIGEIVDEYDVEDPQLERLPSGDVRVNASMLIDELNELLDVEWPSEDWDTLGGLVMHQIGRTAHEAETVEYQGHLLRAEKVKGRRIGRVRITRLPRDDDDRVELDATGLIDEMD